MSAYPGSLASGGMSSPAASYNSSPYAVAGLAYGNTPNTFPALAELIQRAGNIPQTQPQQEQPTPIQEIQQVLLNLPAEQRQVIETSEEYLTMKADIFQEFILWSIAATELGRQYLMGPGNHKAKKLLELTKDLASTVGTKTTNRIQELESKLQQMQAYMQAQDDELARVKAQLSPGQQAKNSQPPTNM